MTEPTLADLGVTEPGLHGEHDQDRAEPGYVVVTEHVQRLIRNGLALATVCNGAALDQPVPVTAEQRIDDVREVYPRQALLKAADDLMHAADELRMEAHSCDGWAQV